MLFSKYIIYSWCWALFIIVWVVVWPVVDSLQCHICNASCHIFKTLPLYWLQAKISLFEGFNWRCSMIFMQPNYMAWGFKLPDRNARQGDMDLSESMWLEDTACTRPGTVCRRWFLGNSCQVIFYFQWFSSIFSHFYDQLNVMFTAEDWKRCWTCFWGVAWAYHFISTDIQVCGGFWWVLWWRC